MSRFSRFRTPTISAGLEIVPPTLMVIMGYPWMGAATFAAVLASSVLQSRMLVRSAQERHRAILAYAQSAVSMGSDPASVITALQDTSTPDAGDEEPTAGQTPATPPVPSPWLHVPPTP
jgi:hypothetical protein